MKTLGNPAMMAMMNPQVITSLTKGAGKMMNPQVITSLTKEAGKMQKRFMIAGFSIFAIIIVVITILILVAKSKKNKNIKDAKKAIKKNNLSFDATYYNTLATRLKEAMDRGGTDEELVFNTLKELRTADDWWELYRVYDNHKPSITSWNFKDIVKGDLTEWLYSDLTKKEMKKAQKILTAINVTI